MGYTTNFSGRFQLDHPLTPEHKAYLVAFSRTQRMMRDETKTVLLTDAVRVAACVPIGLQGGYFVGAPGFMGQNETDDVLDVNRPPAGQPGLWCQWTPTDDGSAIEWDGGEKFYDYVEMAPLPNSPLPCTLGVQTEWRSRMGRRITGRHWENRGHQ